MLPGEDGPDPPGSPPFRLLGKDAGARHLCTHLQLVHERTKWSDGVASGPGDGGIHGDTPGQRVAVGVQSSRPRARPAVALNSLAQPGYADQLPR